MCRVKRSWVIGLAVGVAVAVVGLFVIETVRFVLVSPEPSAVAAARPLESVEVDPSWIKSGSPQFAQVEISRSPDGSTSHGLWSCVGPTTFEWQFALDETVYVLEGAVEIDYQGHQFTLRPGDTAVFHGGTRATWTVDKYVKKTYTLHNPGPLGKLWRTLVPVS